MYYFTTYAVSMTYKNKNLRSFFFFTLMNHVAFLLLIEFADGTKGKGECATSVVCQKCHFQADECQLSRRERPKNWLSEIWTENSMAFALSLMAKTNIYLNAWVQLNVHFPRTWQFLMNLLMDLSIVHGAKDNLSRLAFFITGLVKREIRGQRRRCRKKAKLEH